MASKSNTIIDVDTIAELVNFVDSKPIMFCLEDQGLYGWNNNLPEKVNAKDLPKYEPVQWVKVQNGRTEGLRFIDIAGSGFNSGASSYQKIIDRGSLRLLGGNLYNRDICIGLSYTDANANFNSINFGFLINSGTDILSIYELGSLIGNFGLWNDRDLEIVRNGTSIEYFAAGVSLRQTVCTNAPLVG